MSFRIDGSLYPDEPPPVALDSLAERVDYLSRLCSAWDFGILPDGLTLREIRRRRWRKVVDRCRLVTSPTYHLLTDCVDDLVFRGRLPGVREPLAVRGSGKSLSWDPRRCTLNHGSRRNAPIHGGGT